MKRLVQQRLAAVILVGLSAVASAQTITTPQIAFRRLGDTASESYTFGAAQCNDTLTVSWTNTTTTQYVSTCSSNSMKVWSTTGECSNTPPADAVRYDDIPGLTLQTIRQGTFNVKIAELPGFSNSLTTDGGVVTCGSPGISKTHRVCGAIDYIAFTGTFCGSTTSTATATALRLVYDTQPPSAPVITEYGAQDQGVKITFTVDSDTATVQLEVKSPTDADFKVIKDGDAVSQKTITGSGLLNQTTYDVRLRAVDAAGNISDPSASVAVTPIKTLGFYGYFRQVGGSDGGCSAGIGIFPALALWFFVRRARDRRRNS
ncbi:MAG: hypothetical protein QM817_17945 [Archangium sp.]